MIHPFRVSGIAFWAFCLSLLIAPVTSAAEVTRPATYGADASAGARLLRMPAISATQIAFVYAGDIWIVAREGGEARRLTTFEGLETDPQFSPDGAWVAFTGQYDGNTDVYRVPTEGGEPSRLTWHPLPDSARGFTPDGARVVFASGRTTTPRPMPRMWTVSVDGGLPEVLPMARAARMSFSPGGERIAYQRVQPWESEFRNYRGGQAQPIRVLEVRSKAVTTLPWQGSNDLSPVWLGDTIFFLSDRDFASNVWAYDLGSHTLSQRTHFKDFDCKRLSGGAGALVFENGGYLFALDAAGGAPHRVPIVLHGDFPWARPHWRDVSSMVVAAGLSPTGKRALLEARGEVFTVPAEKGNTRNLSRSSAAADRSPVWAPDGEHIAWFSDQSGEYQLVISDQTGGARRTIELEKPTFYYTPRWSPDSTHLAFGDADRSLWVLEVATGQARKIDNEGFAHPIRWIYPEWSPDSKWIAYSKRLPNELDAIFVYSLESGSSQAITDGLSDAHSPAWDASGKYLYFLASTDLGLNVGWLDLSSYPTRTTSAIYVAVLARDEASPLAPESDDEEEASTDPANDARDAEKGAGEEQDGGEAPAVRIDFAGVGQRILALDVPPRAYLDLVAGVEGTVFFREAVPNEPGQRLHRYTLEKRESEQVLAGIASFSLSADGKKLLYRMPDGGLFLADAAGEPSAGEGALDVSDLRMKIDPAAEWRQIFREAWRFQRDYFYVENVHGLDLDWAYATYAPWVEHVRHRADLTYVLDILGGETSIGHSFVSGGDLPEVEHVGVGLLGADLEIAEGRYRLARILAGENWNPALRSPLSGPGIDAHTGDYLLAVDGVELVAGMNPYALFERTAGRQTVLTLNDKPQREGAREVTVVPVEDEIALRQRDWVEGNRKRVEALSGGRLAYVWVPDTGAGGYNSFTRYFFAQTDKKGAVIDERFNQGGFIADYIIDYLSRSLFGYFNNPVGDRQPFTAPNAAIWGPKVMLINEMSGSGGDMLPYMFQAAKIGPLVGTRTWGGLVGIWDVPPLVDGGRMTAPRGGFYDIDGKWAVENRGVAPDIEVEQDPALVAAGQDPQLEKAVATALALLETEGVQLLPQPPDPVRVKRPQ